MPKKNAKDNVITNDESIDAVKDLLGKTPAEVDSTVNQNNLAASSDSGKFNPTRVRLKGSSVKQEKIAEALTGNGTASGGGVSSAMRNSGLRSIPYSGTDARIIDNASGTPVFDKSDRRDSRYGQKTDNTARHLNYVPSETYLVEVDGPLPLSESADKVQGALGHPANEFARIQKTAEAFPGTENFERSIDEAADDLILATTGQQATYGNDDDGFGVIDPTKTFIKDVSGKPVEDEYFIARSNFVPHAMHVKYDSNGQLTEYYYDETEHPCNIQGTLTAERANTNRITAANRAEVDRQAMALKAGNEVDRTWSPIPYAYPEPTKDVLYLSTVEKQLGAQTFMAVKMAAKAHSYQISKAAKDGMRSTSAGAEICLGDAVRLTNSDGYDAFDFGPANSGATSVFNDKWTSKGAPSAIIAMNDSVGKYHDRADVLSQPRSFNMVLKNGLSNYKPFYVDPIFARVFDNTNVFSTIDKAYDPSTPVCIQDGYKLMNAYSLNQLGSCFRTANLATAYESDLDSAAAKVRSGDQSVYLQQMDSTTVVDTYHLAGSVAINAVDSDTFTDAEVNQAAELVRKRMFKIRGVNGFNSSYAVAFVPTDATSKAAKFLLFSFNSIDDTKKGFKVFYGSQTAKSVTMNAMHTLTSTRTLYNNYLAAWYQNRQNKYFIQLRDPYTDGIKTWLRRNYGLMAKVVDSNSTFKCPVHYTTKTFATYAYIVMMAMKFMQEQRALAMLDVINYSDNFGYPFSACDSLGSYEALGGKQYGQSDIFNQLEVRQMSPDIAIRWLFPELYTNVSAKTGDTGFNVLMPFYMNEQDFDISATTISLAHDRAAMSYPLTRSGVRWSYLDDMYGFEERDIRLILDRIVAPPAFGGLDSLTAATLVYKYSQANDGLITCGTSVPTNNLLATPRELGYVFPVSAHYVTSTPKSSFVPGTSTICGEYYSDSAVINGCPSYRAYAWFNKEGDQPASILSTGSSVISRAATFAQKYVVIEATEATAGEEINMPLTTLSTAFSTLIPFTNGVNAAGGQTPEADTALQLDASIVNLFSRVQKLPVVLNPFDFATGDSAAITTDPFGPLYVFGFAGFKASDFKEDLYNRLTRRMSEGWKYVSDPFIEGSLLCK